MLETMFQPPIRFGWAVDCWVKHYATIRYPSKVAEGKGKFKF